MNHRTHSQPSLGAAALAARRPEPQTASASTAAPVFALVGNPNCGKSTLFNALTGLRQKVGNYPGVTVEKKQYLDLEKLAAAAFAVD